VFAYSGAVLAYTVTNFTPRLYTKQSTTVPFWGKLTMETCSQFGPILMGAQLTFAYIAWMIVAVLASALYTNVGQSVVKEADLVSTLNDTETGNKKTEAKQYQSNLLPYLRPFLVVWLGLLFTRFYFDGDAAQRSCCARTIVDSEFDLYLQSFNLGLLGLALVIISIVHVYYYKVFMHDAILASLFLKTVGLHYFVYKTNKKTWWRCVIYVLYAVLIAALFMVFIIGAMDASAWNTKTLHGLFYHFKTYDWGVKAYIPFFIVQAIFALHHTMDVFATLLKTKNILAKSIKSLGDDHHLFNSPHEADHHSIDSAAAIMAAAGK